MSAGSRREMNVVPEDRDNLLGSEFRQMPPSGVQPAKKTCPKCCFKCCFVFLVLSLIVSAAIALGVGLTLKKIDDEVGSMVASKVALVPGAESTSQWASPDAPVHFKVYMFNVLNKDQFMNGTEKLNVKEVGPFYYRENKTKFSLVWNDDESILGYSENCTYTYDKDKSNGLDPKKEMITTINLPLMGLLVQLEKLQEMAKGVNSSFLDTVLKDVIEGFDKALREQFKENLFMTRSVDEILWGYQDPFLKFISDILPDSLNIAAIPKDGVFSLEHKSEITGPNMIYTGKANSKDLARFIMYGGKTQQTGWATPYANMINGTEAILFHPGVKKTENLTLYVSELFRSGYFSFYQEVNEYGIKFYQFRLPPDLLSGKFPYSDGFYMFGPDGALNLTAVYPLNVPVFVTKPHFLDANSSYRANVTGLHPNRDAHDAYLNVEPVTGAVLDAAKRLQINIRLQQDKNIKEFSSIPPLTYLPLVWVDEGGKLNSSQAEQFKNTVYVPLHAVDGGALGLASAAGFIAVLCLLLLFIMLTYICEQAIKRKRRDNGGLSVRFDD